MSRCRYTLWKHQPGLYAYAVNTLNNNLACIVSVAFVGTPWHCGKCRADQWEDRLSSPSAGPLCLHCLSVKSGSSLSDAGIPLTRPMHGKLGSRVHRRRTAHEKQMCPCPVAGKNGCSSPQGAKDFWMLKSLCWILAGLGAPAEACLS